MSDIVIMQAKLSEARIQLSAATARAEALLLALEAARHEAICAAASGRVRLETIDKALDEARKGATVPQWMATREDTANNQAERRVSASATALGSQSQSEQP